MSISELFGCTGNANCLLPAIQFNDLGHGIYDTPDTKGWIPYQVSEWSRLRNDIIDKAERYLLGVDVLVAE